MRYIITILCMLLFPVTAFAQQSSAPEEPIKKIAWAIENSGPMPQSMIAGLVLLVAMIIITVLAAIMKGAGTNE